MAVNPYAAYATESRAVIVLLGFTGIQDFARRAAINHLTTAELLGTMTLRRGKHPAQIVRAWGAATEAYADHRAILNASQRKHVLDWLKRWRQRLLSASVIEHAELRTTEKYELRRRDRRKLVKKLALEAALVLPGR